MSVRAVVDLHCDTLTAGQPWRDTLENPESALSLSALPDGVQWAQMFAIFIPDRLRGDGAVSYFETYCQSFRRQMETFRDRILPCQGLREICSAWEAGKTAAVLTVEGGCVLNGDLSRVEVLRNAGVRILTLTWNGPNELGSGHDTEGGLTPFGRDAVRELENAGILVDVSHLNDAGFADLLKIARKPFLATHSNARAVCSHRRNLTDAMIREMVARRCLIGLNFYTHFLRDGGEVRGPEDLFVHAARFLDLGAGECLALGSDFDGADLPKWLSGPRDVPEMYDYFLTRGMSRAEADGIFFQNALNFFRCNLP